MKCQECKQINSQSCHPLATDDNDEVVECKGTQESLANETT